MKKSALLLLAIICIGFAACGKSERNSAIYNEKFTLGNFGEIAAKVKSDKDISSEDVNYLTNALKRLSFAKDSVVGKTVKDLIENELRYINDITKKSLADMSNISILRLNTKNIFVSVLPTKNATGMDINKLYFEFDNQYGKPIKSISGEIIFFYRPDSTNQTVQLDPLPFNFDKEIKASQKDTLIFYQKYVEGDKISNIIRNETSRLSGLLNITKVEF